MTFLYDAIAFLIHRTADNAFALVAHATVAMDAKQLRVTAEYLLALADNRESK